MKKVNWVRIVIFFILLYVAWYLFSLSEGLEMHSFGYNIQSILITIVFWPFYWFGFFINIIVGLILEMVWLYFVASIVAKIISVFTNKIKNRNKVENMR